MLREDAEISKLELRPQTSDLFGRVVTSEVDRNAARVESWMRSARALSREVGVFQPIFLDLSDFVRGRSPGAAFQAKGGDSDSKRSDVAMNSAMNSRMRTNRVYLRYLTSKTKPI